MLKLILLGFSYIKNQHIKSVIRDTQKTLRLTEIYTDCFMQSPLSIVQKRLPHITFLLHRLLHNLTVPTMVSLSTQNTPERGKKISKLIKTS